jgi:hypothetical protein
MTRDEVLTLANEFAEKLPIVWPNTQETMACAIAIQSLTMLADQMRHTVGIAETIRSYEGGGKGGAG